MAHIDVCDTDNSPPSIERVPNNRLVALNDTNKIAQLLLANNIPLELHHSSMIALKLADFGFVVKAGVVHEAIKSLTSRES